MAVVVVVLVLVVVEVVVEVVVVVLVVVVVVLVVEVVVEVVEVVVVVVASSSTASSGVTAPNEGTGLSFTQLLSPSVMSTWPGPRFTCSRCSHGLFTGAAGHDLPSRLGAPICGFSLMRVVCPSVTRVWRRPVVPGICASGLASHGPGSGTASFIGFTPFHSPPESQRV
jgi:hypothetical protein